MVGAVLSRLLWASNQSRVGEGKLLRNANNRQPQSRWNQPGKFHGVEWGQRPTEKSKSWRWCSREWCVEIGQNRADQFHQQYRDRDVLYLKRSGGRFVRMRRLETSSRNRILNLVVDVKGWGRCYEHEGKKRNEWIDEWIKYASWMVLESMQWFLAWGELYTLYEYLYEAGIKNCDGSIKVRRALTKNLYFFIIIFKKNNNIIETKIFKIKYFDINK